MANWVQVAKSVYNQMEASAEICHHGFAVNGEQVGWMEVVDRDEDCLWFDYHVRSDFYRAWRETMLILA